MGITCVRLDEPAVKPYPGTMKIIRQSFRYRHFNAVYWLIGVNFFFFVLMYFLGFQQLMFRMSMIPAEIRLYGWIWTFVTYMFVHGNIGHIVFNMLGLFVFGKPLEHYMGSREFLLFYFVTGTLAGILSFFVFSITGQHMVQLIGASGAVFAVAFAYAVFFPDSIIYIWGILPVRAPIMVLGFTALELFSSVFRPRSGVAHLTHLAGFAFAWLYFVIRFNINPWKRLRMR
ncbi:MAG: rhomboid family intramembrane serine protease [Treponema sp.]|nr:rhomboid family intramembrane serine protease [Treponema sp.]